MFNKVFRRGRGKASGIDYLLSSRDAQKNPRNPAAQLMRGSPGLTKAIIRDLHFAQKYTSGVLSWEESPGQISDEVLGKVMDSFEEMVGAGMESSRLNWLWVQHRDKGRIELHYVIPNCDLQSVKRFAPYFDRTDRGRFRAWERHTNTLYGFSDPSDPKKSRNLRFPASLPREKTKAIEEIHAVVSALAAQGVVKNRGDIIAQLQSAGYGINRQAADYISIQDGAGRKLRLRGKFYESTFTAASTAGNSRLAGVEPDRQTRLAQLQSTLDQELEKRARYIARRYPQDRLAQSENTPPIIECHSKELIDGRNPESTNTVPAQARARIGQARGTADNAIQRALSALGNFEQSAAAITNQFAAFLRDAERLARRIGNAVHGTRAVAAKALVP
jgi:hypothetical protein